MECKKYTFLLVAMAVVFLAWATPITLAARNEVVSFPLNTNDVANIRNPLANIFLVQKPAENCLPSGHTCGIFYSESCCGGDCGPLVLLWGYL
ncbi:hypothetical protein PTKIN_Ptkin16aG0098500 [Pterospermum kingtungense]